MNNYDIDDKINEVRNITPNKPASKSVVKKEFTPPVPRLEDKNKEDLENDHKYSRENYYNLIERGQDAIQVYLILHKKVNTLEHMK